MIEWFKSCWKVVGTIVGALAIILGLISFVGHFATKTDIGIAQELMAKDIAKIEIKMASAIENVNKSVQYQFNANRYSTLTDQETQLKLLLRKSPNDTDLKEEYRRVVEDKEKVRKILQDIK